VHFFFQPNLADGATSLSEEESGHAVRVLRLTAGQQITITDGQGLLVVAHITTANPRQCGFKIFAEQRVARPAHHIHMAIAPTKSMDRIEWMVEKMVELGVQEISFFVTIASERRAVNHDRVLKVIMSALKQSQRAWLPKLNKLRPFGDMVALSADQKFIACVDATNPAYLQHAAVPGNHYLVLIGPEGDFAVPELEQALAHGFKRVSLGPHRLRTETAGLAACHILNLCQQQPPAVFNLA